jgi:hypothetical protein
MTYSFWLEQTIAVSRWLDASARLSATSTDRSPGIFTRGVADRSRNEAAKVANVLVLLTKFRSA